MVPVVFALIASCVALAGSSAPLAFGTSEPLFDDYPRRRLGSSSKHAPAQFPPTHAAVAGYWAKTVPEAMAGGAPRAGNATLLFVHIPKTAGSSMERVLEKICDMRPPLCMRRWAAIALKKWP